MALFAQIIIDISHGRLDRPFTYRVPEALKEQLHIGSRVRVPFGRGNTQRTGYIIDLSDHCDLPEDAIKDILGIAADTGKDQTGERAVELAAWMHRRYGSTMITALKTVLGSGRTVRPVVTRDVCLLLSGQKAQEQLDYYVRKHQVARERLLRRLMEVPRQPYSLIVNKLHIPPQTLRAMESQGILAIVEHSSLRNPVDVRPGQGGDIVLSEEQQNIVDHIVQDHDRIAAGEKISRVSLIHGITGSGKTEVYISIIEQVVQRHRAAIMLIPEISLTYQTLLRFYRHFKDRVSVINSTLSEGEKIDQWERARRGEIDVIIGPRSALFTPFKDIGVIVIDEEHENSYKNEQMPKYTARDVAIKIAAMHHGIVVLGSATPSLDSYFHARQGDFHLYTLNRRLTGQSLPKTQIVDMKQELAAGNRSVFSRKLQMLLQERLDHKEQSMLFLNRRGFSGFMSCRKCGHVMKCPHCDVSLSLHRNGMLVCHYCGYTEPAPKVCPECGSRYISGFKAGTEQVEQILHRMLPTARVLRMDADTTARKGSYEKILSAFANEQADILLGTQMIVKGHDFPNVTLVGILLADLSLYVNDYRAAERTFQLLTQAAGRAGRGSRPGDVIIQTYEPDHYAIKHAAEQDYIGFYNEEINYRRLLRYPPAEHMLCVQITGPEEETGEQAAGDLRGLFQPFAKKDGSLLIGPAQASLSRLRDEYRFVLYIKNAKYAKLIQYKDAAEAYAGSENAPSWAERVRLQFDFDPMNPY